jgi:hypothetical protein
VVEFETADPGASGEMTIRFLLRESGGDTVVTGIHENLPSGVSPEDNETGWRMSLAKLASFVERAEEDT